MVVNEIAEKRARLLQEGYKVDPSEVHHRSGRLLVSSEDSDLCCLSEPESDGFIDSSDMPPWDTWICYLHEKNEPRLEDIQREEAYRSYGKTYPISLNETYGYLLCWIPDTFIPHVQRGIQVNPVECFWWASEYRQRLINTPTLRLLDVAGLIY